MNELNETKAERLWPIKSSRRRDAINADLFERVICLKFALVQIASIVTELYVACTTPQPSHSCFPDPR